MSTSLRSILFMAVTAGIIMSAPRSQEVPPPNTSSELPVSVAVFVSSNKPDETDNFSKKLCGEFRLSPDLAVVQAKEASLDDLRTTAAKQHYTYVVNVTITQKKKSFGLPKIVPGHGGAPSQPDLNINWTIEKTGNVSPLYSGQLSADSKSDGQNSQSAAAQGISAIALKIIQDLTPAATAKKQQPAVERPRLDIQTSHATQVSDFVYSKDGTMLATLAIDGVVKIWVAQDAFSHRFNEIRTFAGYRIAGFALSADGKMLATVDVKRTVRVIDTYAGVIVKTIFASGQAGPPDSYLSLTFNPIPVAYSPDGRTIVYGGNDGVPVVDTVTGQQLRVIQKGTGLVNALALSPSGDMVATAGESGQTSSILSRLKKFSPIPLGSGAVITISRTSDGEPVRAPFTAFMGNVSAMAFAPEGDVLVAGSQSGTLRIFDAEGKTGDPLEVGQCDGAYETLRKVGKVGIIAAGPAEAFCKEFNTFKAVYHRDLSALTPAAGVRSLAISDDSKLFTYVQADNTIWLRSFSNPAEKHQLADAEQPAASSVGKSKDASAVLFGFLRSSVKFSNDDGNLHVNCIRSFKTVSRWDAKTGKAEGYVAVAKRDLSPFPIPIPLGSVPLFSKDGSHLLTASLTNGVKSWDLKTGSAEQLTNTSVFLNLMPISADGKYVLRSDPDKAAPKKFSVSVQEVGTETEVFRFTKPFDQYCLPVFSPDPSARLIAVWELGIGLHVYERAGGTELQTIKSVSGFAFNPDASRLAYLTDGGDIFVIPTAKGGKPLLKTKLTENSQSLFHPATFVFSADGTLLAFVDGSKIRVFNVETGQIYREHALPSSTDVSNLIFAPQKKLLSFTTDRSLSHWDLDKDSVSKSALVTDFWGNLAYYPDGKILALGGAENRVRLFDIEHDVELGSLVAPSESDWLMISPEGRIDASRLEDVDEVYWVVKDEPTTTQPMEVFTREFYEPRLLPNLLKGISSATMDSVDYASVNRALPAVSIKSIVATTPNTVKVTVTVQQSTSRVQFDKSGKPFVSGAANLRLFRDGVLVGYSMPYGENIKLDDSGNASLEFNVALPRSSASRKVDFSAYAFNSGNVKGLTTHTNYDLSASSEAPVRRAYIISMGVNSNEANVLSELEFAADDASAMAQSLSEKLKATKAYGDVVVVRLLTQKGPGSGTKEKLSAVLDLLAGRPALPAALKGVENVAQLHKTGPDDMVFFFFAGHGVPAKDEFYLIPSDLGKKTGTDIAPYLKHAISGKELSLWFRDIDAGDLVLVIDACRSAAVVDPNGEFRAAPLGEAGMGQLAYDKGMRVLAAAERESQTLELDQLRHGYLTYALIHDGLQAGEADFHPRDGKIYLDEWLNFSTRQVPKLESQYKQPETTPIFFDFLHQQSAAPLVTTVPLDQIARQHP